MGVISMLSIKKLNQQIAEKIQEFKKTSGLNEFEQGEQYMLYKLEKHLENKKDVHGVAIRTMMFINEERTIQLAKLRRARDI